MPPTKPSGLPTVAVVWAKLIVGGEDRGVRVFLVPINDGKQMCAGVTCK
jgi:acyl-CoA oxidase